MKAKQIWAMCIAGTFCLCGFSGAKAEDVALMARTVREAGLGVKAAGGIRSYAQFREMVAAGATRVGTSAGLRILEEARGGIVPPR